MKCHAIAVSEIKRLKQLKDESARSKRLSVEQRLQLKPVEDLVVEESQ